MSRLLVLPLVYDRSLHTAISDIIPPVCHGQLANVHVVVYRDDSKFLWFVDSSQRFQQVQSELEEERQVLNTTLYTSNSNE